MAARSAFDVDDVVVSKVQDGHSRVLLITVALTISESIHNARR